MMRDVNWLFSDEPDTDELAALAAEHARLVTSDQWADQRAASDLVDAVRRGAKHADNRWSNAVADTLTALQTVLTYGQPDDSDPSDLEHMVADPTLLERVLGDGDLTAIADMWGSTGWDTADWDTAPFAPEQDDYPTAAHIDTHRLIGSYITVHTTDGNHYEGTLIDTDANNLVMTSTMGDPTTVDHLTLVSRSAITALGTPLEDLPHHIADTLP